MSLPLTLAVLDGMVVTVAGQTLVVPLTAIVETLQPEAADDPRLGAQRPADRDPRQLRAADRRRPHPGLPRQPRPIRSRAWRCWSKPKAARRAALLVDAIQGQRQVVIKSLEANYRQVPGIAAATILGDGRVALILDVDAIVAASRGAVAQRRNALAAVESGRHVVH